jgi:hypothetical protein
MAILIGKLIISGKNWCFVVATHLAKIGIEIGVGSSPPTMLVDSTGCEGK